MDVITRYPRLAGKPPEWLVSDTPMRCPYRNGQTAQLPLRLPVRPLRPDEFSQRLEEGDRRQGLLLYRPNCPTCHACFDRDTNAARNILLKFVHDNS